MANHPGDSHQEKLSCSKNQHGDPLKETAAMAIGARN